MGERDRCDPSNERDRTKLREAGQIDLAQAANRLEAAAASAAATTTTTVPAVTAAGAFFTGLGDADVQAAAVEFRAVQALDRALGFGVGTHRDESESLGLSGHAIGNDIDLADRAVSAEGALKG